MAEPREPLNPAFRWETLGVDVVALDADTGRVHRLTGPSAALARHLLTGADHGLATADVDLIVTSFAEEGLLAQNDAGQSRRDVIKLGIAGAIGITTLLLPSAAAAASGVAGGGGGGDTPPPVTGQAGDTYIIVNWT